MAHNPVVWFEIYVQDMARAQRFYENVLQCRLEPLGPPDSLAGGMRMLAFPADMAAPGASGALVQMAGVPSGGGGTLVYFACEDCAVQAARVAPNGGHIHRDKVSIGPFGFIALATDTEGNMFGLHSMK